MDDTRLILYSSLSHYLEFPCSLYREGFSGGRGGRAGRTHMSRLCPGPPSGHTKDTCMGVVMQKDTALGVCAQLLSHVQLFATSRL